MKKREAMRLVKALRSGKYQQARDELRVVDDAGNVEGYCCLGVACEISGVASWDGHRYAGNPGDLPVSVQDKFGFATSIGARVDYRHVVIAGEAYTSLADANDSGCTFAQIADYIEENYKDL